MKQQELKAAYAEVRDEIRDRYNITEFFSGRVVSDEYGVYEAHVNDDLTISTKVIFKSTEGLLIIDPIVFKLISIEHIEEHNATIRALQ